MSANICNVDNDNLISTIKILESGFVRLISARLGIVIHKHQLKELNKSILQACKKFNCEPDEYLSALSNCPDNSPMLEYLVTNITVGETYFFRDAHQMTVLQEIILPKIIKDKRESNNLSLRIWSAGCSTGEEIYTVAMLLFELLPDIDSWTIQLLGTDINTEVLGKAIAGSYSKWSMRSISKYYQEKYFTHENGKYYLADKLRSFASFSYLNLNDDTYPSIFNNTNSQDLILCRNVLIYFNNDHIKHLMKKLDLSMVENGFILLGASDPIIKEGTNLVAYKNEPALFVHTAAMVTANELIDNKQVVNVSKQPKRYILPSTEKNRYFTPEKKQDSKISLPSTYENDITSLLNESCWQEALDKINFYKNDIHHLFVLNAKATALANLGKLDQAVELCNESISIDPANIKTYFTLAMILLELNQLDDAEKYIRKTLYLDHKFIMGHFQLGLLLFRNKKFDSGIKCLRNALAISETKNPTDIVAEFQQLNYGSLIEILKHELDIHVSARSKENADK